MATATLARRKRTYTVDELLAMDDEGTAYELDADGHLEERAMSVFSSAVGVEVSLKLGPWRDDGHAGFILGADVPLQIWPEVPKQLRRSDVAFISSSRLPDGRLPRKTLTIPPDLVVEVVSPRDIAVQLERKIAEYLEAGVRLVWVIYPEEGRAQVRRIDGTASIVGLDGSLDGEDVLPGFAVKLADIIPD